MSTNTHDINDYINENNSFCQKVDHNKLVTKNIHATLLSEHESLVQLLENAERNCRDEISRLQCSIQSLQEDHSEVQNNQHRTQQNLVTLTAKLHQLQCLLHEKELERYAEQQRLDALHREVATKRKLLDDIIERNKECSAMAGRGVSLFERHLGLTIHNTSSNITIFSFTQVQLHAPERVFKVAVTLQADRYLLSSDPPLPGLEKMQETLNKTNNLVGFLGHARKLFKKVH